MTLVNETQAPLAVQHGKSLTNQTFSGTPFATRTLQDLPDGLLRLVGLEAQGGQGRNGIAGRRRQGAGAGLP